MSHTKCFDQQYSSLDIDLKTVVTLQKLAILGPIGIYHVYTEISDGVFSQLLQKNGRPMVLYSSLTAGNAEWLTCSVIARGIRLVPVFRKQENVPVSVFVSACRHETEIVALDDRSFFIDSRSAGLVSMYENVLSVVFRTFSDGIFLFSGAEQGDLLVAQIIAGRVYIIFDFGSLSYMEISGGTALNDGAWHELRWVHEFDSVELIIDGVLENSTSPTGLYRKLDFHTEIEIGGRPFDAQSNTIQSSYRGCLASVRLNNIELLSFAPKDVFGPCSVSSHTTFECHILPASPLPNDHRRRRRLRFCPVLVSAACFRVPSAAGARRISERFGVEERESLCALFQQEHVHRDERELVVYKPHFTAGYEI
ncbi:hypothetical protein L596_004298 [Steinernema carpocapsae]|uniref:Laminin G domain-containing protein n=1 Tax=Steinernema carpocapsae TaxID=34508 RepID=A0A4U8UWZ9_STECR|nr:hypothetical protein L596_004298 [Steinernema carpocapsae]